MHYSKNVPEALTGQIEHFSQDRSVVEPVDNQFIKFIICADGSTIYRDYFEDFDHETYNALFIRSGDYETSFSGNVPLPWVRIDYVIAHSLGLTKDEL